MCRRRLERKTTTVDGTDNCGSSVCKEHREVITGCQACADAAKMGVAETPVDEETATAATIGIEAKTRPVTYAL